MTLEQSEKERRTAQGNVRALSVVIGLMADGYPDQLACQYIRECVELKLIGDLMKKETSSLKFLAKIMTGDTYEKLVELLSEPEKPEEKPAFEMPDTSKKKQGPDETATELAKYLANALNRSYGKAKTKGAEAAEQQEVGKTAKAEGTKATGRSKAVTRSKAAKGKQAADGQ